MSLLQGMDHPVDIVKKAFEHRLAGRIPRGELWLGSDLLKKAGLEDNLQGHLSLMKRLGQDILCLPLSMTSAMNETLGYRYFNLKELEEASRMDDVFVMAIIDGPFQQLVGQKGLMNVLGGWKRERAAVARAYEKEREAVDMLIKQCLGLSIDAAVIADDVAGERSPFVDPVDIEDLFRPFYTSAVSEIHRARSYALFHSCGNIQLFIPHLVTYGFDGLAAIQHRANDLFSLKEWYGAKLAFMAGIEAEILKPGCMSSSGAAEYRRLVRSLALGGGFILCSSSGLYSRDFLPRIQELYRIADEISSG
jgi:hypothetical protein